MTLVILSLGGLALFLWPFAGAGMPSDSPAIAVALGALGGLLLIELGARRLDVRALALLAAIAAIDAALRLALVSGIGGFSPIFFLILCAGYVFGPAFGFEAGALAMLVSAIATGGVGPWLPYQLFAAGWVGVTAGVVGGRLTTAPSRRDLVLLAAVGVVTGFAFGALMDVWDWTFFAGSPDLGWVPGAPLGETIARFGRFYLVTSFAYDAFRAVGNGILVVVAGAPVLAALARLRARLTFEVVGGSQAL
ncbi:MAG: ECF transporter S component [Chloroflexi bacterium]|nr:ECF transporter S component [Chloroflexota bacterium]